MSKTYLLLVPTSSLTLSKHFSTVVSSKTESPLFVEDSSSVAVGEASLEGMFEHELVLKRVKH